MIKKWINTFVQRLRCRHEYQYQFAHLVDSGMRKMVVHKCTKCGKIKTYFI